MFSSATQSALTSKPVKMDGATFARIQYLLKQKEEFIALLHEAKGDDSKVEYRRSLIRPLFKIYDEISALKLGDSVDLAQRSGMTDNRMAARGKANSRSSNSSVA